MMSNESIKINESQINTNLNTGSPIHKFKKNIVKLQQKEADQYKKTINQLLIFVFANLIGSSCLAAVQDLSFILSTSIPQLLILS